MYPVSGRNEEGVIACAFVAKWNWSSMKIANSLPDGRLIFRFVRDEYYEKDIKSGLHSGELFDFVFYCKFVKYGRAGRGL